MCILYWENRNRLGGTARLARCSHKKPCGGFASPPTISPIRLPAYSEKWFAQSRSGLRPETHGKDQATMPRPKTSARASQSESTIRWSRVTKRKFLHTQAGRKPDLTVEPKYLRRWFAEQGEYPISRVKADQGQSARP